MAIERCGIYEYEIFRGLETEGCVYKYEIYVYGCPPYDDGIIHSTEYYEAEQEARFAVIGHIDLLEKQRGQGCLTK